MSLEGFKHYFRRNDDKSKRVFRQTKQEQPDPPFWGSSRQKNINRSNRYRIKWYIRTDFCPAPGWHRKAPSHFQECRSDTTGGRCQGVSRVTRAEAALGYQVES
jgi:hypothetical protein